MISFSFSERWHYIMYPALAFFRCLFQLIWKEKHLFTFLFRFCFLETAHCRTLLKGLWAGVRMNKGLIRNLWHHLPAPHSQKNRAQPNSVSRFCQNYFCSTLETSSGGSKAKTVNDHGWLSFTRFDLTPFIEMLQKLCNSRVQNKHRSMSINFLAFFQELRPY